MARQRLTIRPFARPATRLRRTRPHGRLDAYLLTRADVPAKGRLTRNSAKRTELRCTRGAFRR